MTVNIIGTTGDDVIQGYMGDSNWIWGDLGNDWLSGANFADLILGGVGDDTINGHGGDDVLYGGFGRDLINGGDGNDGLYGEEGDDNLYGGAGDDTLDGGEGADFLSGASGNDTADYSLSTGRVWVSLNSNMGKFGHAEGDTLWAVENLVGSEHDFDWLQGNAADNRLEGLGGNDVLQGLAGDDTLDGGNGDDYLEGGDGDDNLIGGNGHDEMYGDGGDDWFIPGLGDATVDGGDGTDTLDLRVYGDTIGWTVDANTGNAKRTKTIMSLISIVGLISEKMEISDAQAEVFMSKIRHVETVEGLSEIVQSLELKGFEPFGKAEAAPEMERVDEAELKSAVEIAHKIFGEATALQMYSDLGLPNHPPYDKPEFFDPELGGGGYQIQPLDLYWEIDFSDIENFVGSYGSDVIHGNELDNEIYGSAGDDELFGHGGDDFIYSGSGNNNMNGGDGDDVLLAAGESSYAVMTGGDGDDEFLFFYNQLSPSAGLRGEITDFVEGDLIEMTDSTVTGLDFLGDGEFHGQGGAEMRIDQTGNIALVEIDNDGDGTADWWIDVTMLDPGHVLSGADFLGL